MEMTINALERGFANHGDHWSFEFGDGYSLCFELLNADQMYVALYKGQILLTNKVVVKPGKI